MNKIFHANVAQIWGNQGIAWLAQLPEIITHLAQQWQLTTLNEAKNLSYNYLLLGHHDQQPIALKIGYDAHAYHREKNALITYNGTACIQLIDYDDTHNALLLERALPGNSLKDFFPHDDTYALTHMVHVMQQLHTVPIPTTHQFETLADTLTILHNPPAPLTHNPHTRKAVQIADHLLTTQPTQVLLHGDLHHDNILACSNSWKAIDPKGVVGDPLFDICSFVRNPFPELLDQKDMQEIMHQRMRNFSTLLNAEYTRIQQWNYVAAVISACWAIQDGQNDPQQALLEAIKIDELA